MVGASKRYALPTDVPQPQLRLEMCHSFGMVVDDRVLQDLHRAGALARELRPHQAQQEGEGARGDEGEEEEKVTTLISATSILWLELSSLLQLTAVAILLTFSVHSLE